MVLSIRKKLGVQVLVVLLLFVLVMAIGIIRVGIIDHNLSIINEFNTVQQRYAINFRSSVYNIALRTADYIYFQDPVQKERIRAGIDALRNIYNANSRLMDDLFIDRAKDIVEEERVLLANIKLSESTTMPLIEQVFSLNAAGSLREAYSVMYEQVRPEIDTWINRINAFIDFEEEYNIILTKQSRAIAGSYGSIMIITLVVLICICVLLSLWIAKSIKHLAVVADSFEDIARGAGDLTVHMTVKTKDEVGKISENFNTLIASLHHIVGTVRGAVTTLSRSGNELQTNMSTMTATIENVSTDIVNIQNQISSQASQVTDVSDTMAQINSDIERLDSFIEQYSCSINDNTQNIDLMVRGTHEVMRILEQNMKQFGNLIAVSETGFRNIHSMREKIMEISEKSQGVSDANAVINSIASQTNLLAMNAAIEAAHAGEAGKGFAVVADEIRKLAEHAAQQSKSISAALKKLIESISDVVDTSRLAGQSFEEVMNAIDGVQAEQVKIKKVMENQAQSSARVSDSFDTLQSLNNDITKRSVQMREGSLSILNKTEVLVSITNGITASVDNMAQSADNIKNSVNVMNNCTEITQQGIKNVHAQIGRFIL